MLQINIDTVEYDGVNPAELSREERYALAIEMAKETIEAIKGYDGLKIELKGCWVWVSGNTKEHRNVLKPLGFFFNDKGEEGKFWCWRAPFLSGRTGRRGTKRNVDAVYGTQLEVEGASPMPL